MLLHATALALAWVQQARGAAAAADAAATGAPGCEYTRNPGSYREAGPITDGVPQPAGNLQCHFGAKVPLAQFKQECDAEPKCVGFSFTAPAAKDGVAPTEGEGCLKNNYDPHVWGHVPGFEGYDKGRWDTDWRRECNCSCSGWGVAVLMAFGLCGLLYVGGGIAYGHRASGGGGGGSGAMSVRSHPHWQRWQDVYGLAHDGASFVRAHASGRASYRAVPQHRTGDRAPQGRPGRDDGDAPSPSAAHAATPGAKKAHSKGSKGKKERREEREEAQQSAGERERRPVGDAGGSGGAAAAAGAGAGAGAPPTAGAGGAKSSASQGGGRWVHVTA